MLTTAHLRTKVVKHTIAPSFIDPAKPSYLQHASALVELFTEAAAQRAPRQQLDEAIRDQIGADRSQRLLQGLAKLLMDRAEFDVQSPVPPAELRAAAFRLSAERGPLALGPNPLGRPTAADLLSEVGAPHDLTAEQVADLLYADLDDAKRLQSWRPLEPTALLHRYNLGLVQALLLRALSVTITLDGPDVGRVRQLLRHAKFHQLLHRAERDGKRLRLHLDGPAALFKQSTRYGLQLAQFFPALPLQTCPWSLDATILWTKAKHRKDLHVDHTMGLQSHYRDTGAWISREQQWFVERFHDTKNTRGWTLSHDTLPLTLGGRGVMLPDVVLQRGEHTVHLEIIGYWRKDWLERRLEGLRRHGDHHHILAVSKRLKGCTDALADFDGAVIPFAKIVPVKAVLDAADALVGAA